MIDIMNIWGLGIILVSAMLIVWVIYPIILDKFTQYIQTLFGVRMMLVFSIGMDLQGRLKSGYSF